MDEKCHLGNASIIVNIIFIFSNIFHIIILILIIIIIIIINNNNNNSILFLITIIIIIIIMTLLINFLKLVMNFYNTWIKNDTKKLQSIICLKIIMYKDSF